MNAQDFLNLWQQVTSKPMTSREVEFAARVEAKAAAAAKAEEREACAQVCDGLWQDDGTAYDCREAIRARGETK